MSVARRNKRESQKHLMVLADLLMGFYELLERKDKPSDEEVRSEFTKRENQWKRHCSKNQLTEETSLLFNKEVAQSWENRYTEKK